MSAAVVVVAVGEKQVFGTKIQVLQSITYTACLLIVIAGVHQQSIAVFELKYTYICWSWYEEGITINPGKHSNDFLSVALDLWTFFTLTQPDLHRKPGLCQTNWYNFWKLVIRMVGIMVL